MCLKSENTQSLLVANMEVPKAHQREIGDDPDVSSGFFLRYDDELALGHEECSGCTKRSPQSINNRWPPHSGQYSLRFGPIT